MKRYRILFLIESLVDGGAEKVLTTLVQHIDKTKFDVTVCSISGGGPYEQIVKRFVRYKAIITEPRNAIFFSKYIYILKHHFVYKWLPLPLVYKLFVPQGNDVEIAYIEGFTTKLLSHSSNTSAKKYAWIHIDLFQNHWTKSIYRNLKEESDAYNCFNGIYGVSQTVLKAFQRRFPNVNTSVRIMYNPIDSNEIKSKALEMEKIRHCAPLLVTVGRLEPQKGYDRLVRIAKRLVDDGIEFELWIIGIGSQESDLKRYIKDNHLEDYVKLLGFHTNPYKYIVQGNLFVCSSYSEGYSTAVTEALILGIPVITTNCSGMAELLKNGECGMITENDEQALYDGVKQLLEDDVLLEDYRKKAVERGRDFTIESLMKPIEKLLIE